jgi:transcriptional regulator
VPQSTLSDQLHPDKQQLRSNVLEMRARGLSYREIAQVVGLHWTRIQQICEVAPIKAADLPSRSLFLMLDDWHI